MFQSLKDGRHTDVSPEIIRWVRYRGVNDDTSYRYTRVTATNA